MKKVPITVKNPSYGVCCDRPYLETDMEVVRPRPCGGLFATTKSLLSPITIL